MNALWNVQLKQNLRIILFNNSGGEIFAALPGLTLDERSGKFVTAEHQAKGRLWAQECGFKTYEVTDNDGFLKIFDEFIRNDNTNKFMEVITDKTKDIDALKIAKACKFLGAGRVRKDDKIDLNVGIYLNKHYGDKVNKNELIATIYYNNEKNFLEALQNVNEAFEYSSKMPPTRTLLYKIIE